MHQLSTPLILSKSITQNKFLIDWALAGEPQAQQDKVIIHSQLSSLKTKQLKQFDGFENISGKLLQNDDGYIFDKVEKRWH